MASVARDTGKNETVAGCPGIPYTQIMAAVETFKSAVVRIRDILRGPGVSITGMDSMRHICLYLLSRYMTRDRVGDLGVPEELCWENFMDMIRTQNGGVQKALDLFYHPEVSDCLLKHFDRLFDTSDFPFAMKNIQRHKEILEILDAVKMSEVDCHMDILGWVYEQHLRTGSSAARDLGQFFTDRFICEYMTDLCKPAFKSPGVPESVCDPSMGTGGFLTSYMKYFAKHHTTAPIDWSIQQKEIHGCDTDAKVAGVARLNLFMQAGGHRSTNLLTHDSLYGDLPQTGYDVILANMPFGLKGIKHADCCERVKALKIRGTKSEPLFLQLMMVSLNRGGRCAVVVPDGMLVNNSSCHNETRQYLLDNFELRRVIKMKGQFFMNTGIQPSILFFENTGKPTEAVEFWEVVKADKGEITETLVLSVPRSKIASDASSSLDMRRYLEAEKPEANSAGFPMVKLGDILTDHSVKNPVPTTHADNGEFSLFSSSCDVFKHSIAEFSGQPYLLQGSRGTISKATHYCTTPFSASNNVFVLSASDPSALNLKYIYYFLRLSNVTDHIARTSVIPMLTKTMFRDITVPFPPLHIQQEIVTILDRIFAPGTTELADTLHKAMDLILANPAGAALEPIVESQRLIRKSAQMVADVKAQMVADVKTQMVTIMKSVGRRGFPVGKLGDFYESPKSVVKFNSSDMTNEGDVPFYNGKWNSPVGFHTASSYSNDTPYFVGIKDGGGDHTSDKVGMGKFFRAVGKCAITSHNVILIPKESSNLLHDYVYYYLYAYAKEIRDKAKYSINLGSISIRDIYEFPIPIPPMEFQKNSVKRMDFLQIQLTALESLQSQTEDNARFIMESYLH